MTISNRKLKYIRSHYATQAPEEISEELSLDLDVIEDKIAIIKAEGKDSGLNAESLLKYGILLLVFFSPLLFLRGTYDGLTFPKIFFIQISSVLLALIAFFNALKKGYFRLPDSIPGIPVTLFLTVSLCFSFYGLNKFEGLYTWGLWAGPGLLFIVLLSIPFNQKFQNRVLWAVLLSATVNSLIGLGQYFFQFSYVPQVMPPGAIFGNRNMAAQFIVLALPAVLPVFLCNRSLKARIGSGLIFCILLTYLMITGCRAARLAIGCEFAVFVIFIICLLVSKIKPSFSRLSHIVIAAMTFSAIMIFFALVFFFAENTDNTSSGIIRILPTTEDLSDDTKRNSENSSLWRLKTWGNTLEMIKDYPILGVGLGNHKVHYPEYHRVSSIVKSFSEKKQLANVHNDFLQYASETGLVGAAVFLYLFCSIVYLLIKNIRNEADIQRSVIYLLALCSIAGISCNAFFSFPLHRPIPPFILAVYCALAFARSRNTFLLKNKKIILTVFSLLIVALFLLIKWHSSHFSSNLDYAKTLSANKHGDWNSTLYFADRADISTPWRRHITFYKGRALLELGRHQEAVCAFKKVLDSYPYYFNARYNMALAYERNNEMEKALESYRETLLIKPDHSMTLNNIGCIYLNRNNLKIAEKMFRKAINADPENSIPYSNMGIVRIRNGNFEKAEENFRKSLSIDPNLDIAQKNIEQLAKWKKIEKDKTNRNQ